MNQIIISYMNNYITKYNNYVHLIRRIESAGS